MAVYTKLSKADAGWLAKRWALGEVKSFEGIAKGSVNTNYRLVTSLGTYFVRLDETRTKAEMEQEVRLVQWIASRDYPTPESLPDTAGKRVGTLKEKPVALFPFLPGEDRDAAEYAVKDLESAGEMLARLHAATAGFPEAIRNRFGRIATAARWARIRTKAKLPKTDRDEIDEAVASFSAQPVPAGPVGIVHGDWFADNLLFEGKRITGVLDFEAAATDSLGFDVATAINALCWKPSIPDRFDPKRVRALLAGYAAAKGPAPLDEDTLRYWLRATALRFTVTRIQDFRMKRSAVRVEKDYHDFLRRLRFWSRKNVRIAA